MSVQDEQNQEFYSALLNMQKLVRTMYQQALLMESDNGVPCGRTRLRLSRAFTAVDEAVACFNYDVIQKGKPPSKAQLDRQYESELS